VNETTFQSTELLPDIYKFWISIKDSSGPRLWQHVFLANSVW